MRVRVQMGQPAGGQLVHCRSRVGWRRGGCLPGEPWSRHDAALGASGGPGAGGGGGAPAGHPARAQAGGRGGAVSADPGAGAGRFRRGLRGLGRGPLPHGSAQGRSAGDPDRGARDAVAAPGSRGGRPAQPSEHRHPARYRAGAGRPLLKKFFLLPIPCMVINYF